MASTAMSIPTPMSDLKADRETLILSLTNLVNKTALKMVRKFPFVSIDEYKQAGWVGAIQAVDSFHSEANCQLRIYAAYRIRGAMLDFMRGEDFLSRSHRRICKQQDIKITKLSLTSISEDEIPIPDKDPHSNEAFERSEACRDIEMILSRVNLSERYKKILFYLFFTDYSNKEAGALMGITQTRISQIKMEILYKIRVSIREANKLTSHFDF